MSYCLATTITITTSTGGAYTGYTKADSKFVHAIRYKSTDTASTADLTITDDKTGIAVLATTNMATNVDATWYPRSQAHTEAGAATGGHTQLIPVGRGTNGGLKIVMAQGGNTKSGTLYIVFG